MKGNKSVLNENQIHSCLKRLETFSQDSDLFEGLCIVCEAYARTEKGEHMVIQIQYHSSDDIS